MGMTYGGLARYIVNVGSEDFGKEIPLGIFPNPTSDRCSVQFANSVTQLYWTLATGDGKIARQGRHVGSILDLDLSGTDPGTYVLEIVQGGTVQHGRIVVQ